MKRFDMPIPAIPSARLLTCLLLILTLSSPSLIHAQQHSQPGEAEQYFNKARELEQQGDRRSLRKIYSASVKPLNKLADRYLEEQRYDEAIQIYQRLYTLQSRLHGDDSSKSRRFISKLSYAYQVAERHVDNIATKRRLLEYDEQRYGKDHPRTIKALNNLAFAYKSYKAYAKAESIYKNILRIYEQNQLTDDRGYRRTQKQLASVYNTQGDMVRAEPHFRQSLGADKIEDITVKPSQFIHLFNYGNMLQFSGKYAEAETLYLKILAQLEAQQHPAAHSMASVLGSLGELYSQLGAYDKALSMQQRSFEMFKDHYGENHFISAYALSNQADTYLATQQNSRARTVLEQAAGILELQQDVYKRIYIDENFVLPKLAEAYARLGEHDKAEKIFTRVITELGKTYSPRHPLVTYSSMNLAELYYRQGRLAQAAKLCLQSLSNAIDNRSPRLLARVHFALARIRQAQGLLAEAIFFGKQSINHLQGIRSGLVNTEKSLQKSFVQSQQHYYEILAGWLVDAGRLSEAEQVLAMLKEEEYFNFIRRSEVDNTRTTQVRLNRIERQQQARLHESSQQLVRTSRELSELEKAEQGQQSTSDKQRLVALHTQLREAERQFQQALANMNKAFSRSNESAQAIQGGEADTQLIRTLGKDVGLLHILPLQDRLLLILRTASRITATQVDVSQIRLNRVIKRYREHIKRPDLAADDLHALSQQLYQWLIKPVENNLQQASIDTLMLYKNGTLRYIPLASLHDGKDYLIEKYALSTYTAAARESLRNTSASEWNIAGMGVSKGHGNFAPLRMVPYELDTIIRKSDKDPDGVFAGQIFVDEAFTAPSLKSSLDGRYNVSHIATHYKFIPGTESDSFLLMGDGSHLSLASIRKQAYDFRAIDLLTLSACDTAVGGLNPDGSEIEGLATLVQKQGAKGILATLWPVADCSTGQFMQSFYQYRQQGHSKAAALRKSQLDFIRQRVGAMYVPKQQDSKGCRPVPGNATKPYSHPYYWAPFILMGNWQ